MPATMASITLDDSAQRRSSSGFGLALILPPSRIYNRRRNLTAICYRVIIDGNNIDWVTKGVNIKTNVIKRSDIT